MQQRLEAIAERAFQCFNPPPGAPPNRAHASRYGAGLHRSPTVVVVVGEVALAVTRVGFEPVSIDASQLRPASSLPISSRSRPEALLRWLNEPADPGAPLPPSASL